MNSLLMYRSTTNSMNWEWFSKSFYMSKRTGKPKKWLRFNGQVYKPEK